jgi:hypothetical protein
MNRQDAERAKGNEDRPREVKIRTNVKTAKPWRFEFDLTESTWRSWRLGG